MLKNTSVRTNKNTNSKEGSWIHENTRNKKTRDDPRNNKNRSTTEKMEKINRSSKNTRQLEMAITKTSFTKSSIKRHFTKNPQTQAEIQGYLY